MTYLILDFVGNIPKYVRGQILDDSNVKMNLFDKFFRFLEMFFYLKESFDLGKTNDQISLIGDHSDSSSVNCFKSYFKSAKDESYFGILSDKLSWAMLDLLNNWLKEWKSILPYYRYIM